MAIDARHRPRGKPSNPTMPARGPHSWRMSQVRGKNTWPELRLRAILVRSRLSGWRTHLAVLPGRPDFVFEIAKVAVFVDGAFWHGHPSTFHPHRLSKFWREKILGNRRRDRRVCRQLKSLGWRVIRIWDHDIRRRSSHVLRRISDAIIAGTRTAKTSGNRFATRRTLPRNRAR